MHPLYRMKAYIYWLNMMKSKIVSMLSLYRKIIRMN